MYIDAFLVRREKLVIIK